MADARVLTVILNWQTPEMTLRAAATALVAMEGIPGEIIVVDNDSGDGSFEAMQAAIQDRGWSRIRVMQSGQNGGYGAGNNFGVAAYVASDLDAMPDYIYILNSDAFPAPDAIRELLNYMENNREVGFSGSLIVGEDGVSHQTAFRFPSIASEFETAVKFGPISRLLRDKIVPLPVPETTCKVDWLAGASLMMRREVLEDIGLFDEAYFLYFEETDLSLRAQQKGWSAGFVRESVVTHIGSVSTGMKTQKRMPRYWFDSRLHYFLRNHGRAYAWAATLAHLGGGSFAWLRGLFQRKSSTQPKFFLIDMAVHGAKAALFGAGLKKRNIPRLNMPNRWSAEQK